MSREIGRREGGLRKQAAWRRKQAETIRGRLNFIPVTPFRVVPFRGGLIQAGGVGGNFVTDYHVCDARGRTAHVVSYTYRGRTRGIKRAEWIAAELNALVTEKPLHECPYCGADRASGELACEDHLDLVGLEAL